jgi:hypothetical protein
VAVVVDVVDVVAFSGNFFLWWIDVDLWWMWWHFPESLLFYPPQSTTSCVNRSDPPQLSETIDLLELVCRNGSWLGASVVDCGACFRETPIRTPYKGVFRNVVPHPPQSWKSTTKWEIHHRSEWASTSPLRMVAPVVSTALDPDAGANPEGRRAAGLNRVSGRGWVDSLELYFRRPQASQIFALMYFSQEIVE